jgi:hypothetical protein
VIDDHTTTIQSSPTAGLSRRAALRGLSGGLLASGLGRALPRVASAAQDVTLPPVSGRRRR